MPAHETCLGDSLESPEDPHPPVCTNCGAEMVWDEDDWACDEIECRIKVGYYKDGFIPCDSCSGLFCIPDSDQIDECMEENWKHFQRKDDNKISGKKEI